MGWGGEVVCHPRCFTNAFADALLMLRPILLPLQMCWQGGSFAFFLLLGDNLDFHCKCAGSRECRKFFPEPGGGWLEPDTGQRRVPAEERAQKRSSPPFWTGHCASHLCPAWDVGPNGNLFPE